MHIVSDRLRITHNSDGGTVLDIRHGQLFGLNLTGSRVLELLKSGLDAIEISRQIASEFNISPATAEGDVLEFLQELLRHGLVHEQPS